MRINIKPKGTMSPPKTETKIVNILPITQAKNKDFLKLITKNYPESFRNWVLKTYPRPKRDSKSPCQIIQFKELTKKVVGVIIGIFILIGGIFTSR